MWQPGDVIVRREVWHGKPYGAWGGHVVSDEDDLLVLYMPEGSPLEFEHDFFGAPHPWGLRAAGAATACCSFSGPEEMHWVWVFWDGPARDFAAWYVNVQEPLSADGNRHRHAGSGARHRDRARRQRGP